MAGRGTTALRKLWPRTRRAWAVVALCALTFLSLNLLVVRGSELALDLLISLSGALAGLAAAHLATYPLRRKAGSSGIWRTVGLFVGLGLVFVIIFGGTALAGIPPFPTAEGGNVGTLIYGFALGFGIGATRGLIPAQSRVPELDTGPQLKVVAVILGVVAALFALLFVLSLLLEYAIVPLIRTLAG